MADTESSGQQISKDQLEFHIDKESTEIDQSSSASASSNADDQSDENILFKDWGFDVEKLFQVAYRFYKRNESKAFHPTFDLRNHMNALILQSRYGNYDPTKMPDVGALDLVGKSRRHEWSLLSGMTKTEAMTKFICTLDEICPIFKAHVKAVKIYSNSQPQSAGINTSLNTDDESSSIQDQFHAIHTSLCRQTYSQFKSYAEERYPNDPAKQKEMIVTLQEQYYQQYISQMHPELSKSTRSKSQSSSSHSPAVETVQESEGATVSSPEEPKSKEEDDNRDAIESQEDEALQISEVVVVPKDNVDTFVTLRTTTDLYNANQSTDLTPNTYSISQIKGEAEEIEKPSQSDLLPAPHEVQCNNTEQQKQKESLSSAATIPSQTYVYPPVVASEIEPSAPSSHVERTVDTWSCGDESDSDVDDYDNGSPLRRNSVTYDPFEPATIWTKKGVAEFKDSLANDKQGGAYEVNLGILLTIQVPTYPDGKYIYWEFATDDYDIGFGVDFVYDFNLREPLKISMYERSDEDEESEEEDDCRNNNNNNNDTTTALESASHHVQDHRPPTEQISSSETNDEGTSAANRLAKRLNTLVILPTYRRDSHEEVIVGRHKYPGPGYYLLKFDNTYSVLRSKSLYYRICYFI